MNANAPDPNAAPPSTRDLIWLFVRWLPSVLLVTSLSPWALVMMDPPARVIGWTLVFYIAPFVALPVFGLIAIYALVRRRVSRPMVIASVVALLVVWPRFWPYGVLSVPYPSSLSDSPPVELRVPTDVPMRVYWGGDTVGENYHVLYPDQRYAYDLTVEPAGVMSSKLEDYGCFGVRVRAPLSGVVLRAHDGEPDETPGVLSETAFPFGNHVVIALPDQGALVLAHLKSGSVRVKTGDTVVESDVLGECGNSGRTSEPHIHLHAQDWPVSMDAVAMSEGRPIAFRGHEGPAPPRGGVRAENGRVVLEGDAIAATSTVSDPR